MNVKNISWKGFASGWPAEQQGQFTIGPGVLGEVVINNQNIAPSLHEMFGNTGRRIGCDIGEPWWAVALRHDNHGVRHRTLLPQDCNGLRDGGGALPYRAIDAYNVLITLVQDGGPVRDRAEARARGDDQEVPR